MRKIDGSYRNNWLEFTPCWFPEFALCYDVAGYHDSRPMIQIYFIYGKLFIHLPFKTKYEECDPLCYGIKYHDRALWFHYWRNHKCIRMPWDMDWIRTSCLKKDGTWEHGTKYDRKEFWDDKWKDILWNGNFLYRYTLKNGEIQEVAANIRVEEREWRPLWFKWTKLFAKTKKDINVEFSNEVGERAGMDWKGGCTGCFYEMLPDEKPYETLKRMEKERIFK
jgi:hypothetical protein